jgi:hypothetical protein
MSNPIETVNQHYTKVSTRKAPNETNAQWFARHFQNVLSEWDGGQFPLTDELCTNWLDANGVPRGPCTQRNSGETDAAFLSRHADAAAAEAAQNPPSST